MKGQLRVLRVRRDPRTSPRNSGWGLTAEMKLLLALEGALATLILAWSCEGTAPGKSPLDSQGGGQWRGSTWVWGNLWLPWTLSPIPSKQLRPGLWRPQSFRAA